VVDEEDVVEGAGRDATLIVNEDELLGEDEDIEEWGWFRKPPFRNKSFAGSIGGVSIRSEAFL
jgi:hypothetical protein